ncbi:MAG: HAMP domain-containing protein [Candidatus Methylomirabilis oxyfera]|nr:HAMP domain-containing protein [Candidatus Methylomirabilis oxyfera]
MLSIKNWSIGTRLLLAFILVLAPFVGFVSIAGLHFGVIMHSYIRIQEEATVRLKQTSDVMTALDDLMLATEDYRTGKGRQERRRVNFHLARLHELFRILSAAPFQVAEERQWVEALGGLVPRIEALGRKTAALAPSRPHHDALVGVSAPAQLHDRAAAALHHLMDIHVHNIDDAMRHVSDVGQQVVFVTFVTLTVSALGAVAISVPLAHWLSRPIRAIAQGSRRLTEGDLSQRVETTSGGELGEAAQAFNEMAQRLERSAIENAALYGAAHQRAERIAAVNRLTKIIGASLDIGAVYETFAEELKRFIPYARMGIVIAEKSGARFKLFQLAGNRLDDVPIGMVWSNGKGTGVEWVMANRRPYFERDLATARRFVEDGALLKEGVRSTVRLPLIATGQVIGVLFLDDVAPGRYTEGDLELLIPLGEQLTIAIENSRLHGEMERKVEERTETLRETQAQLIQSGKLAAVGTLAAGVAHELNQPLMIIRGYAQELLTDERVASEEIRDDLRRIEAQTTRMTAIINHLRDFSRESKGKREIADLNRVVEIALIFLGQQLKSGNIVITRELHSALPTVRIDPLQIEQVLLNLITNARDAMESTVMGVITTRTDVVSGGRVALSVTDTGPGIPEEIRTRIFDPFFTTKEVGKGTGLGLSICHGIIEAHGGALMMESPVADGRGARFTMILPQAGPDDTTGERI